MAAHEPVCVGFKVCAKCGETKRVLAFSARSDSRDGLLSHCRDCSNERRTQWVRDHAKPRKWLDSRVHPFNPPFAAKNCWQ